jgi:hypothetical protein
MDGKAKGEINMANYNCVVRTNYFHVKDAEAFEGFMEHVHGDDLELFYEKDGSYGFGGYGSIYGYVENVDDDDCEESYDDMIKGLQTHLADGDAIIITEVGFEKLRYLVGLVTVITQSDCKTRSLDGMGLDLAKLLLNDPNYNTQMDY